MRYTNEFKTETKLNGHPVDAFVEWSSPSDPDHMDIAITIQVANLDRRGTMTGPLQCVEVSDLLERRYYGAIEQRCLEQFSDERRESMGDEYKRHVERKLEEAV